MNPAAPVFSPTTQTSSLWTHTSEAVLLQTAQASVFNPDDPQRTKRVRIVFDIGSQRSHIKEQLKSDLNLTVRGRQSMSIMTYGSRDMCVRECDLVHVGTELMGGGTRLLSLYAVHCKNIWVTSTIFWSSQSHACCVCDKISKECFLYESNLKCSHEASLSNRIFL